VDLDSTIIAVSSPPGPSAVGLIRLSGGESAAVMAELFEGIDWRTRGVHTTRMAMDAWSLPVVVMLMPGPTSYTTEDVIEVQLPGNPLLLEGVIDRLIESGVARGLAVRRALPGEFTYRAWHHGRLALDRAEAVSSIIAANSTEELAAARHAFEGQTGRTITPIADDLADVLALVEVGIDFSDEEDVVVIPAGTLVSRLSGIAGRLGAHLGAVVGAESMDARPRIVLRGPVNAGKSTLFNALLGSNRVVTHEYAGTTRDAIVEPLLIGVHDVLLVDTPGDEDAACALATAAEDESDLVVWCSPSCGTDAPAGVLRVRTKHDLRREEDRDALDLSAFESEDVDRLRVRIADALTLRSMSGAGQRLTVSQRQGGLIERARAAIAGAIDQTADAPPAAGLSRPAETAALLRQALDDLGAITGTIPPDDVLGRVFASFCIGK
jgi:tRNA modification GTPase